MRQSPVREALAGAEPVLRELGQALAPGARVTIVPGNHDHHLVAPWLARRARDKAPPELAVDAAGDWRAGEPLSRIARWVTPRDGEVELRYPGVWLRDDTYATHGHYADRHVTVPMLERLGAGAMARVVAEPPAGPGCADDYERVLAPMYAWLDALAQTGAARGDGVSAGAWQALSRAGRGRNLRRRALALAFPALVATANRAGLGPLRADLSSPSMRQARLHALGEVMVRLGISARHVISGHTHRAGPLPADDRSEWRTVTAATLTNAGCWVHDAGFLGPDPTTSPFRAGFAVSLDESDPPVLANLLDPR